MDDKTLQQEFDEYFTATNLPENMTEDAKAHVKSRNRGSFLKWFKFAPAFLAALVVIISSVIIINNLPAEGEYSGAQNNQQNSQYSYYSLSALTSSHLDEYSASEIRGLEFAHKLAILPNASITLTGFNDSEKLVFAQADVILLHNGYRHDTKIFAEYTDEYYCNDDLKDYLNGETGYYRGYRYTMNTEYDDGENVYKIYLYTEEVKYYISVMTSETNGYMIYLDLLKNI